MEKLLNCLPCETPVKFYRRQTGFARFHMVKLLKTVQRAKDVEPNCIRLERDLPARMLSLKL